jgi:hypothetical protein
MNARSILRTLTEHGAKVVVDGDRIKLVKPVGKALPADLVDAARAHRDELRTLAGKPEPMPQPASAWGREDWQAFFDEAAGVAEADHGRSRPEAEAYAFGCCVTEWLNRNFEPSPPGRCLQCGGAGHTHPLLPFGTERAGHAWLHASCHPAWQEGRKAKAVTALAEVGISNPQPVTAAEAIRRGLVLEYVTGKISAADE